MKIKGLERLHSLPGGVANSHIWREDSDGTVTQSFRGAGVFVTVTKKPDHPPHVLVRDTGRQRDVAEFLICDSMLEKIRES